jgi:ABC-type nickel/cobalt efflux system permease component RcnA
MAKHEKTFVDFDKPYETNIIGLRGVIYFSVGLFLLIVVTFGLMWFLQNVMEDDAMEADIQNKRPMQMSARENLCADW